MNGDIFGFWEEAVDDFEGSAVAADGQEVARSFGVSLAREVGGFSGAGGVRDGEINS